MNTNYFSEISTVIEKIKNTQSAAIERAGRMLAGVIAEKRLAHLFGSGHSVIPVLDIFPRYGSFPGFHPLMDPPWGGPVRLALASGVPVVSFESEPMSALVGPAAYLVKAGDTRLLGAALITVLVEEGVSQKLAQAGRQRAGTWSPSAFVDGLAQAYESILKKIRRNHDSSRA